VGSATPAELACLCAQFLMAEVAEVAAEDDELAQLIRFQRYLLATRVFVDTHAPGPEAAALPKWMAGVSPGSAEPVPRRLIKQAKVKQVW
jgi:hypothetical protein